MCRRDALLDACRRLREKLPAERVRLYEFVDYDIAGPRFRGVVEIGGVYANFMKLDLPASSDWYSRHTLERRQHGEPILYPSSAPDPAPPRYVPWAFWRDEVPEEWVDILLMKGRRVIGKLSIDNFFHPGKELPRKTGDCRAELQEVVETMGRRFPDGNACEMVEAHRRRILLNDLLDVLQNLVHTIGLDRARAYEFNLSTDRFEARAEIGGTTDPTFTKFNHPLDLSRGRDDPISFFTYETREIDVYVRDEKRTYAGPHVDEEIQIVFACDKKVGPDGLGSLMDIPLLDSKRIVGKISADCARCRDGNDQEAIRRALEDKRDEIKSFAEMATSCILTANSHVDRFGSWQLLNRVHRGMSQRTRDTLLALASAVLGGLAAGVIRSLFDR